MKVIYLLANMKIASNYTGQDITICSIHRIRLRVCITSLVTPLEETELLDKVQMSSVKIVPAIRELSYRVS